MSDERDHSKAKVGRNAPCPCGSGSKFKKCCGVPSKAQETPFELPPELREAIQFEADQFNAKEHRRRLMQELGRPIISFEHQGYRFVAVGATIHWSKTWKTFHDFLFEYMKHLLTPEWGLPESAKPSIQQHPLIRWIKQIAEI